MAHPGVIQDFPIVVSLPSHDHLIPPRKPRCLLASTVWMALISSAATGFHGSRKTNKLQPRIARMGTNDQKVAPIRLFTHQMKAGAGQKSETDLGLKSKGGTQAKGLT